MRLPGKAVTCRAAQAVSSKHSSSPSSLWFWQARVTASEDHQYYYYCCEIVMPVLLYSPFLSNTINFLFTSWVGLNLVVEVFPLTTQEGPLLA